MGNAQLVVDTSADTAQAEEEETVDLDLVLPDAEDNAVMKDMAVAESNTDTGSQDDPRPGSAAQE